jgi:hypothetical protein
MELVDAISMTIAGAALALSSWNYYRAWRNDSPRLRIRAGGALTGWDPGQRDIPWPTIDLYNPGGRVISVVEAGFTWESGNEPVSDRRLPGEPKRRLFPIDVEPRKRVEVIGDGGPFDWLKRHEQGDKVLRVWARDAAGKIHRAQVDPEWSYRFRAGWKVWRGD